MILPAGIRAIQYFIWPLPLPIRMPSGFAVIGISGMQRNQIFCFSLFLRTVIIFRLTCSNCFEDNRVCFRTRKPYTPCCVLNEDAL